jgi:hypothetical protein
MSREWQPGDVAMIRHVTGKWSRMMLQPSGRWACSRGPEATTHAVSAEDDVRPLVVIDPEDREAVERLLSLFFPGWAHVKENGSEIVGIDIARMQAALREFADPKPPKPEEPTGLYAVVEDTESREWCRIDVIGYCWQRLGDAAGSTTTAYAAWDAINAVRVLSVGVTP